MHAAFAAAADDGDDDDGGGAVVDAVVWSLSYSCASN